ncbi:MAG TPA: DUF6049 family protein [Streptosporangiaceae bacterium]|nr:DUF6049 family protein [Streptosporangiaceae bacterium]
MSPQHGPRVHPAARLTTAGAGAPRRWTTALRAGRVRTPRAGRALAASLTLAAIGLPAAVLASQAPAAAAAGKRVAQRHVSVAITDMTPQHAGPGSTITVRGTVTNSSRQPISNLSVQLLASSTPLSTSAELRPGGAAQDDQAGRPVRRGIWKSGNELQPGSTDRWYVQVKASSIGMTRFGVYPLTARAQSAAEGPLAAAGTYLPYVPARKGPYGSSIPSRTKIAWALPLIDKPLLGQACQGSQAQALAASLRGSGRLGQILEAAGDSAGTADAYSAAARSTGTARSGAVRSEQVQSLSAYDGVTWAVDPALLANVKALEGCGSSEPGWASTAKSWLTELRRVTAAEPVFFTPYADPDIGALISHNHLPDVRRAFTLGRSIGQQILPATVRSSGVQSQASGIAWPADGVGGLTTVETLPAMGVTTLLVGSSALLAEQQSTVVRTLNDVGHHMTVMLANAPLSRLLAAGGSTAAATTGGSAFATVQDFLAQTALTAEQDQPGGPIIVAPPQRWDPATGLAADLLAETASAPWLSPASLTSLAAGKHIPDVPDPGWAGSSARISKKELGRLDRVDHGISELDSMAAKPNDSLPLALATIESSAWRGKSQATARAMLTTVLSKIDKQESGVQIFAEPRVTLGGLKGSVPVSIDNRLGYAVKVALSLHSDTAGVKITPVPDGVVTVPPHTALTVRLHVQATQVGSSTVTMSLLNKKFQPLPHPTVESMTIEATQVGVLGVIICAAAIGVLLIAYAARAVRRAHPAGGHSDPAGSDAAPDQGADHSTEPAEPDTVMAERTQLGAAGAPGP